MKIVNSENSNIKPDCCDLSNYSISGCLYVIGNIRRCTNCIFSMKHKNVLILITQSGDWEGLFIDDVLIDEAHTLGEGNSRLYLLIKSEEFGFKSTDVKVKYINNEDEAYMEDAGNFPQNLNELKGKY